MLTILLVMALGIIYPGKEHYEASNKLQSYEYYYTEEDNNTEIGSMLDDYALQQENNTNDSLIKKPLDREPTSYTVLVNKEFSDRKSVV